MRIAYIGLSGPIFYDYKYPARQVLTSIPRSPNPVLDSPFGLFLLFDEIWFLARGLCPDNMRDLSYVHFLDEESLLPQLNEIDQIRGAIPPRLLERYVEGCQDRPDDYMERLLRRIVPFPYYRRNPKVLTSWLDDGVGHLIKIGGYSLVAGPLTPDLAVFDIETVNRLKRKHKYV